MKSKSKISNKDRFSGNPRNITSRQMELLKEHIQELGDLSGVIYCHNNKAFVGGNQRSEIFNGCEVQIVEKFDPPTATKTVAQGFIIFQGEKYAYREVVFTKEEFDKACIVANNDGGTWDYEILSTWDRNQLTEWGFDTKPFDNLKTEDKTYTKKIISPLYSPKGEKPTFEQLVDKSKLIRLHNEIEAADISDIDKEFLKLAAYRHLVFNYKFVADYYAHSSKAVQELMEKSALIIIDFNKAIDLGFIEISDKLLAQYKEEYE